MESSVKRGPLHKIFSTRDKAHIISLIRVSAGGEEQRSDRGVPKRAGDVQRRLSVFISTIDVRARFE